MQCVSLTTISTEIQRFKHSNIKRKYGQQVAGLSRMQESIMDIRTSYIIYIYILMLHAKYIWLIQFLILYLQRESRLDLRYEQTQSPRFVATTSIVV